MNFIDLHTDLPLKLLEGTECYSDCTSVGFERFLQNTAFWFNGKEEDPWHKYNEYLNKTLSFIEDRGLCVFKGDRDQKKGIILSVENGGFLSDNPDFIYKMQADNIKIISLTWNGENPLGGGAGSDMGLTKTGRKIIELANSLNIALDISHLSNRAAPEAVEAAKYPLATHSNCSAIKLNPRNLSDEVLIKIRDKNGLVGLCFYPEFLGDDLFYSIGRNILHLLELNMEKNISIGTDFDGGNMSNILSTPRDIYALYDYLVNMGIKKSVLDAIFYENAIAFLGRICQN